MSTKKTSEGQVILETLFTLIIVWFIVVTIWGFFRTISEQAHWFGCSLSLIDSLKSVKLQYQVSWDHKLSRYNLTTWPKITLSDSCSSTFGKIDKTIEQKYLTTNSLDTEITSLIQWGDISQTKQIISKFYPSYDSSVLTEKPGEYLKSKGSEFFTFFILPLCLLWFLYVWYAVLDFNIKKNQLKYSKVINILIRHKLGRRYLWIWEDVDTEIYSYFQKVLTNSDFEIYRGFLNSWSTDEWIISVNWSEILRVSGVSKNLKLASGQAKFYNSYSDDSKCPYEIEVSHIKWEIPIYLKSMVNEKLQISTEYKLKLQRIDSLTKHQNQQKQEQLDEAMSKRQLLWKLQWVEPPTEFNWVLQKAVDIEKIGQEYKAITRKMEVVRARTI